MEATHLLESQGHTLLAGSRSSSPRKPLTLWRVEGRHHQWGKNPAHNGSHSPTGEPRTGVVSRVQIQLTTEAIHHLKSQGQASSAGSKSSSPWKPLTIWRAKDMCCQQGTNPAHHRSHSTHPLESQGHMSAGSKSSSPWKPLTIWRAKDTHC